MSIKISEDEYNFYLATIQEIGEEVKIAKNTSEILQMYLEELEELKNQEDPDLEKVDKANNTYEDHKIQMQNAIDTVEILIKDKEYLEIIKKIKKNGEKIDYDESFHIELDENGLVKVEESDEDD
jgi:hypothetical protein